jgi:enoyl-CoA hydratase/carnithine racemase
MAEPIKIKNEGEIALIILNRPEAYNSFDLEMVELLANNLVHLSMEDSVSACSCL